MSLSIFLEDVLETLILEQDGLRKILKNDKLKFVLGFQNSVPKNLNIEEIIYLDLLNKFIQDLGEIGFENKILFDELLLSSFTNDWDEARAHLSLISDIKQINSQLIDCEETNYQKIMNLKIKICNLYKCMEDKYWNLRHQKYGNRVVSFYYLRGIQKISRTPYNYTNKKIVYLDTNIISYLMDNQIVASKFIKAKEKYDFCYSAYTIEDKVKQNSLMKRKNIIFIENLTNNLTAYRNQSQENVLFAYEPAKSIYDRVELWLDATEAREENEYTYYYLHYEDKNVDKNFNNYSVEQMLNYLNDIGVKEAISERSIVSKINYLFLLFNRMEFKRDSKNKSKIISSFQDKEHLTLAWKSNIFVSNDKKMLDRAKVIYKLLELEVQVMKYDEFISKLESS